MQGDFDSQGSISRCRLGYTVWVDEGRGRYGGDWVTVKTVTYPTWEEAVEGAQALIGVHADPSRVSRRNPHKPNPHNRRHR